MVPERDMLEHAESLGLEAYIAKRIVDAHQGIIEYFPSMDALIASSVVDINCIPQSKEFSGCFYVNLTFDKSVQQDVPNSQTHNFKILIADDNHVNQLVLRKMFSGLGNDTIEIAQDGLEAYQKYVQAHEKKEPFDIVFMDIQMPRMNGIEATRKLRQFEKINDIEEKPILALTAFISEDDRNECYAAGMSGFLGKPVTKTILLDTLFSLGKF
jgi:CheY-like chemotaxis protein